MLQLKVTLACLLVLVGLGTALVEIYRGTGSVRVVVPAIGVGLAGLAWLGYLTL